MNTRSLKRRLGRVERSTGMCPPCRACHGVGARRVVIAHASHNVVEYRGCPRCGKVASAREGAACH